MITRVTPSALVLAPAYTRVSPPQLDSGLPGPGRLIPNSVPALPTTGSSDSRPHMFQAPCPWDKFFWNAVHPAAKGGYALLDPSVNVVDQLAGTNGPTPNGSQQHP